MDYQNKKNWLKRVLWRTVFSAGTASESKINSDVFIGVSLRIPLIDGGDPRADPGYTKTLEDAINVSINVKPRPNKPGETAAELQKWIDKLKDVDAIKKSGQIL